MYVIMYTVKKSVDFTVNYLASGCQFFYRYFNGRLPVEHFKTSQYGRVMLSDNTRKYLYMIVGLYDKNSYVICYRSVPDS